MTIAVSSLFPTEPSAVDRVVAGLTAQIQDQLAPGASLPSESDMASTYLVSRLTIREAVRVLMGRGLLDLGRGRRAFVREPSGEAFSDLLNIATRHDAKFFFDLIEVRQALEIQSAALAGKRVNRAGLAAIEGALGGMGEAVADIARGKDRSAAEQGFNQFDIGFHEALALASGNRMLTFLLDAMAAPLAESFRMSTRGRALRGQTHAATLAAHQLIFEHIRQGDGRAAARAMRTHLKDAERDLRAALGGGTRTDADNIYATPANPASCHV